MKSFLRSTGTSRIVKKDLPLSDHGWDTPIPNKRSTTSQSVGSLGREIPVTA